MEGTPKRMALSMGQEECNKKKKKKKRNKLSNIIALEKDRTITK
jgi:hypothetical protein